MVEKAGFTRVFPLKTFSNPRLKFFGQFTNLLLCTRSAARVVEEHPELVMHHILRDPTKQVINSQNILSDGSGSELVRDSFVDGIGNIFYSAGESPHGVKVEIVNSVEVPNYPNVTNALRIVQDKDAAEGWIWADLVLQKRLERQEGGIIQPGGIFTIRFDKKGAGYQSSDLLDVYEFFFNYIQNNPDAKGLPILDLGSGLGHVSFMLSLFFENVFGIEQSAILTGESMKAKRRLGDFIIGNVSLINGEYSEHDLSKVKLAYSFKDKNIVEITKAFLSLAPGTRIFAYGHPEDVFTIDEVDGLEFVGRHKRDHFGARQMCVFDRV
jgi:hypothetical protein